SVGTGEVVGEGDAAGDADGELPACQTPTGAGPSSPSPPGRSRATRIAGTARTITAVTITTNGRRRKNDRRLPSAGEGGSDIVNAAYRCTTNSTPTFRVPSPHHPYRCTVLHWQRL